MLNTGSSESRRSETNGWKVSRNTVREKKRRRNGESPSHTFSCLYIHEDIKENYIFFVNKNIIYILTKINKMINYY